MRAHPCSPSGVYPHRTADRRRVDRHPLGDCGAHADRREILGQRGLGGADLRTLVSAQSTFSNVCGNGALHNVAHDAGDRAVRVAGPGHHTEERVLLSTGAAHWGPTAAGADCTGQPTRTGYLLPRANHSLPTQADRGFATNHVGTIWQDTQRRSRRPSRLSQARRSRPSSIARACPIGPVRPAVATRSSCDGMLGSSDPMSSRAYTAALVCVLIGLGGLGRRSLRALPAGHHAGLRKLLRRQRHLQLHAGVPEPVRAAVGRAGVGSRRRLLRRVARAADARTSPRRARELPAGRVARGLGFVLYLAWATIFVLGTLCLLCLATYAAVVGLFFIAGAAASTPMIDVPDRLSRDLRRLVANPLAIAVVAIVIGATAASAAFFPKDPESAALRRVRQRRACRCGGCAGRCRAAPDRRAEGAVAHFVRSAAAHDRAGRRRRGARSWS